LADVDADRLTQRHVCQQLSHRVGPFHGQAVRFRTCTVRGKRLPKHAWWSTPWPRAVDHRFRGAPGASQVLFPKEKMSDWHEAVAHPETSSAKGPFTGPSG